MVNFHSYVSLPEGNHLITGVPNVSLKIRGVPAAALRPHFVRWNPGKCLSSGLEPCPVSTKVGPWKNRKTKRQSETSFQICFPHVCNCLQSLGTLTSKLQKAQDCVLEVGLLNSPWAVEDFCNSTYQPSLGSLWASQLEDIHLTQLNTEVQANQRTEPFQLGRFLQRHGMKEVENVHNWMQNWLNASKCNAKLCPKSQK